MSSGNMTAAHDGRCRALTKSGRPCGMRPGPDGWCFAHHPDRAAERARAASKGGRVRHAVPNPDGLEVVALRDVEAIQGELERVVAETRKLGNSVQRSKVLGGLLSVAMNLLPRSELEERLQRVEALLREVQGHQLRAVQ